MTSTIRPSLLQMLEMGQGMDLEYIDEAYDTYMMHYDVFFYIPKMNEQLDVLIQELINANLVDKGSDGKYILKTITIKEALEKINGTKHEA